jgi:hypothetical protein
MQFLGLSRTLLTYPGARTTLLRRSSFIRTLRFAYWRELLCEHATEEDQLAHARTLAS